MRGTVVRSAVLCALAGCGGTLPGGPWRYPTVPVVGTVTLGGQPIRGGFVTVQPLGPTIGDHTIGRIDADGTFQIPDAPVGPLVVQVQIPQRALPAQVAGSREFARFLELLKGPASPLRFTTDAAAALPLRYDLDLLAAYAAAQRMPMRSGERIP